MALVEASRLACLKLPAVPAIESHNSNKDDDDGAGAASVPILGFGRAIYSADTSGPSEISCRSATQCGTSPGTGDPAYCCCAASPGSGPAAGAAARHPGAAGRAGIDDHNDKDYSLTRGDYNNEDNYHDG
ncbi:Uu.00g095030.m01.CDS01 [Anthostomella pinea]|uniref:Uu.00g095030.m01.CDS01 n=1 Tax=Anthostomella pinea TaxID=933095 RepID=A0AAI8VPF2_9PEZI|nr:Uu.00g095030.m01.CDS01 [Anthostomella pinea]